MQFKARTLEEARHEFLKHKKNKRLFGALLFIAALSAVLSFLHDDQLIGVVSIVIAGLFAIGVFKAMVEETHYRTVIDPDPQASNVNEDEAYRPQEKNNPPK